MVAVECWKRFVSEFLGKKSFIVIYGEAGSGKTSMALSIARRLNEPFYYINTEGSPFHERALQVLKDFSGKHYFLDSGDMDSLVFDLLSIPPWASLIIVDSVNSFFRVEMGVNPDKALQFFSLANGILAQYASTGRKVVVTAQVTMEGEPSGLDILSFYASNIVRMDKPHGKEAGEIYCGDRVIGSYRIVEGGIQWTSCWL